MIIWVTVLLLVGLNGPIRYVESHKSAAACWKSAAAWQKVPEAQMIRKCIQKRFKKVYVPRKESA